MNEELERKIRERAHQLWEADGRPEGREFDHWVEAERQVMTEEGEGEPTGEQPELSPGNRPEPQPEIPADPLRNPEHIRPTTDPEYPATPGPQEMPASREPQPEIPAESGISEVPAPAPGAADTARKRSRGTKSSATGMTEPARTVAPAGTTATPGATDEVRKRGGAAGANGKARTTRSGKGKSGEASVRS